jgi:hypothetical protein
VEVREIDLRPSGAFEGLHVGLELNQIAGNEARSEATMAKNI